jgi:hypothetical protein
MIFPAEYPNDVSPSPDKSDYWACPVEVPGRVESSRAAVHFPNGFYLGPQQERRLTLFDVIVLGHEHGSTIWTSLASRTRPRGPVNYMDV